MTVQADLEHAAREPVYCCDGSSPDDVVVSGMSGRFPLSDSIDEFKYNLYNKINMVVPTESRWPAGTLGIPHKDAGVLKDLSKFDANFFGIPHIMASLMDPEQRLALEVCYEAIVDAGYNIEELKGGNIAVYGGSSSTDTRDLIVQDDNSSAYESVAYMKCLLANRITYALDFHGPSLVTDTACSSSGYAFDLAFQEVKHGRVQAALVIGSHLCTFPRTSSDYFKLGVTSQTGQCRVFDESACGFSRSEAVTAVFMQRASEARRIYAKVINTKLNGCGFSIEGIAAPSQNAHMKLYQSAFSECGLSFDEIQYLEAHGTGTPVGDPIEVNGITDVYCKNRKTPLLIGSSKSNMGHSEGASAMCGLIKAVLAMETGIIAPNIKYTVPNKKCPALTDGRIVVVTEPTKLTSNYIPVNSYGLGGSNAHIILKKNTLSEITEDPESIPRLVLYSATTEEGVRHMLDYVMKENVPKAFLNLLHNNAFVPTERKPVRGYAILDDKLSSEIQLVHHEKREVWFVMTGMGCQWPGMGCSLMQVDVFAKSMKKSAEVLKQFGVDLFEIIRLESGSLQQRKKISPAFVSICAIQIALIDALRVLGVTPDGIVGHSVGELLCAYADGCCTAEQTILLAYWRGRAIEKSNLQDGEMAAVGMSWEEAKKTCPKGVFPACHNAADSVTISGYAKQLQDFVNQLKKEKRFARIVDAYGYGFHSQCVSAAAPVLKSALNEIISSPKKRSTRWKSSSFLPEQWDLPEAKIADANYFVHNLTSTVHFAEALASVPKDAIILEIGPHHLLQSILKRVIGKDASYLGMMERHEDNVNFMLTTIGKLYGLGLDPKIENLYPRVKYPVPRGTPNICSHIKWDHSISWHVPAYKEIFGRTKEIIVKLQEDDRYLMDHTVAIGTLYPAAGYVALIWETFARLNQKKMEEFPVLIENFKLHRATIISATDTKTFSFIACPLGGQFQIFDGKSLVATGSISVPPSTPDFIEPLPTCTDEDESNLLSVKEVYNELRLNGYEFGPAFQGIANAKIDGSYGHIKWTHRWIPFIDAHMQFFGIFRGGHGLLVPTAAVSIKIDPLAIQKLNDEQLNEGMNYIPVTYDKFCKCCRSPVVELAQMRFEKAPERSTARNSPVFESYHFIPYTQSCAISKETKDGCREYIEACSQIAKKIAPYAGSKAQNILSKSGGLSNTNEGAVYEKYGSEDHVLFNILSEVASFGNSDVLSKNISQIFQRYIRDIGNDILYKTLLKEYPLRTLLEAISENSKRKFNMTEVSNGCPPILPHISDLLKKIVFHKLNLTLLHPQKEDLDVESLQQMNIEVKALKSGEPIPNGIEQDVVISSYFFGDSRAFQAHVKALSSVTAKGGFILMLCRNRLAPAEAFLCALSNETLNTLSDVDIENVLAKESMTIVAKQSDSLGNTLYLLRTDPQRKLPSCKVVQVKEGCYSEWVEELKDSIAAGQKKDDVRVWLVAEDSPYNGVVGMMKCLTREPGGEKARCLFVVRDGDSKNAPRFDVKDPFYADVIQKDLAMNIYKDGSWGSFSHINTNIDTPEILTDYSFVDCLKLGDLSSLKWVESPIKYNVGVDEGKVSVHVCFSSLNSRDVLMATGRIPISDKGQVGSALGFEYSGVLSDGRRVMGTTLSMGIATTIMADPRMFLDIPDSWSLEEAATVPVIYSTCYYALIVRGHLSEGESILIHSGAGGIGTAAIRIALSLHCTIFVTVDNDGERGYLRRTFPQIKDECIGYSGDTSFEKLIMKQSLGEGVDVVLNYLADNESQTITRCLRPNGRFLQIGKYTAQMGSSPRPGPFDQNRTLRIEAVDCLWEDTIQSPMTIKRTNELMTEGLRKGVVQPLERRIFQRDEVEEAFRCMQSGKHLGKVILKIRDEPAKCSKPSLLPTIALKSTYFYKEKTYIIIGGLGGFGIETAKWLGRNGAQNIILTSRHGPTTAYHRFCLHRWRNENRSVTVSTLNVANRNEAKKLLEDVLKIRPIGGVFNSAVVLNDTFLENQSTAKFEETCAAKAEAMKHIDELTRVMCPDMDLFVCFSSISCGKGNAGQTNYGYANSVMERICEKRRQDGLHGLAIQWGVIGDVGVVHRNMGEDANIGGVMAQRLNSCLETLGGFLQQEHPVVCSYVAAEAQTKDAPFDIIAQLAKSFGFRDPSMMRMDRTLREMGMDSILSVELQQVLESMYDISASIKELQEMKVGDLPAYIEASVTKNVPDISRVEKAITASYNFNLPEKLISQESVVKLSQRTSGPKIFFVHYSLSELSSLNTLIQSLSGVAYGLMCTKGTSLENIQALATSYLKDIQKMCPTGFFHLVGLSSASSLAIEIANLCQNSTDGHPMVQSLTILHGANHLLNSLGETAFKPEEMELSYLHDFVSQFATLKLPKLKKELQMQPDMASKISHVADIMHNPIAVKPSRNDIIDAVHQYITVRRLLGEYHPHVKLTKDITIIDGTNNLLSNDVALVKSAVSQVTKEKVSILRIPAEENFLLEHDSVTKVAQLLNMVINPILLQ